MTVPTRADRAEQEQITLRITDEHVTIKQWTSYSFASDFLTPSDGFHFTIGASDLDEKQRNALKNGARVSLICNSMFIADGRIDNVDIGASAGGGTVYEIAGRDRLGYAVDATADPTLAFDTGATLADVLSKVFEPFGWVGEDHFLTDPGADRIATKGDRGTKFSKSKKRFGAPLKSYTIHALKPYHHEGVFDFAKRVSQRFGLWIWCTADGEQLIVGKPDFEQEPTFHLRRDRNGNGNILSGKARFSAENQPSVIIADSFSGGGEYGKGRYKVACVNPYYGFDENGFVLDEVAAILKKVPEAEQITLVVQPWERKAARTPPRPMYLHDDESKTPDQLKAFVRREMSLLVRKSVVFECTVAGHGQDVDEAFTPWQVNTIATVDDEVTGLKERMFVLGLQFDKSRRGGGTTTNLHLVRLNSIQF